MISLKTPREIAHELAGRIRERRLGKGWTQKEMAARAGLKLATYIRFERSAEISLTRLLSVFDVLNLLGEFDAIGRHVDLSLLRMEDVVRPQRKRGKRRT